jgi:hypothetical protein
MGPRRAKTWHSGDSCDSGCTAQAVHIRIVWSVIPRKCDLFKSSEFGRVCWHVNCKRLSWLVVKLRGLDVASFPHFCHKLAKKNSRKQHERADGALTAASDGLDAWKFRWNMLFWLGCWWLNVATAKTCIGCWKAVYKALKLPKRGTCGWAAHKRAWTTTSPACNWERIRKPPSMTLHIDMMLRAPREGFVTPCLHYMQCPFCRRICDVNTFVPRWLHAILNHVQRRVLAPGPQ